MPRGARLDAKGALHHVMVRGLERRKIFLTERDRKDLVSRLAAIIPKSGARIYAWSLLSNHFHLLIRTGSMRLPFLMRRVLTGYAISFNRRHRRSGHLFQNRYKSILVEEEPYLLELVRYIHLNPLRVKMVNSVDQLENYPWSGHSALMGKVNRPWQDCDYILSQFGKTVNRARLVYRKFIGEGVSQGRREDLMGGGLVRSLGGWEKVKELRRGREKWAHDERVLGGSEFVQAVLKEIESGGEKKGMGKGISERDLAKLIRKVSLKLDLSEKEVIGGNRRRNIVEARDLISYIGVRSYGMSLTAVAGRLKVSKQSVLRGVEKGLEVLQRKGWNVQEFIE